MNKKGAEMTIGTIIVIILALVVLVVIIFGFSTGWSNLWGKITSFGGGTNNVQSVVDSCKLACSTNSVYDYCELERDVTFGDTERDGSFNCESLESEADVTLTCDIDCTTTETE